MLDRLPCGAGKHFTKWTWISKISCSLDENKMLHTSCFHLLCSQGSISPQSASKQTGFILICLKIIFNAINIIGCCTGCLPSFSSWLVVPIDLWNTIPITFASLLAKPQLTPQKWDSWCLCLSYGGALVFSCAEDIVFIASQTLHSVLPWHFLAFYPFIPPPCFWYILGHA